MSFEAGLDRFPPNYTEADLDPYAIGDAQHIAGYVRSVGYRVKASDVDLLGNLDRVIRKAIPYPTQVLQEQDSRAPLFRIAYDPVLFSSGFGGCCAGCVK